MDSELTFNTFEIVSVALHLLTLIIVTLQFLNTHKGDCRGAVVSTRQNPDGYCVTREAKLSMHEMPHEAAHELQHELYPLKMGNEVHIKEFDSITGKHLQ